MTAQILQFTPQRVADARAELVAHARQILAASRYHAAEDILAACDALQDWGDEAEKVQARVVRRRTLRIEHERQSPIAERMRDQEAAARFALTMPPRRNWPGIICAALAFVAAWWAVLAGVML